MLLKSNSKTQAQDWLSPGWAQRAGLGLGSSLARASLTSHTPGRRALPPGVPRAWWCDAVGRARSGRAVPPGTWRGWQREGQRLAGTGLGETCGRRASGAAAGPGRGRAGLGPPAPQLAGGSDPSGPALCVSSRALSAPLRLAPTELSAWPAASAGSHAPDLSPEPQDPVMVPGPAALLSRLRGPGSYRAGRGSPDASPRKGLCLWLSGPRPVPPPLTEPPARLCG